MNKCYLQDTKVLFHPFEGESFEVGELKDANIENGYLILNNQCYPLEERFECEKEIIEAWKLIYPDGKPIELPTPQPNPNLTEQQLTDIIKFALENNAEFRALVLPIV